MSATSNEQKESSKKTNVLEEKPALESTERIHYDKETLMKLRDSPASQNRPSDLSEDFLNDDDIWDPDAWHSSKASSSRTASPMVDQKNQDRRKEQVDDGIELAPHRKSFRQGCGSMSYDGSDKNDKHSRSMFDKKNRLTGRASGQRKNIENYRGDHGESGSGGGERNYGDRNYDEKKCDRYGDKDGRKGRYDKYGDKENRQPANANRDEVFSDKEKYHKSTDQKEGEQRVHRPNERGSKEKRQLLMKNRHQGKEGKEESLPEWVTDGPTSQLDTVELTGFEDIEEEKKAYARSKKKSVRISPDVEEQSRKLSKVSDTPSSRKSTPLSSKTASKEDLHVLTVKDVEEKPPENPTSSKSPSNFNLNEFLSGVNYYPPEKFEEDGNGIRSRFTQYFQRAGARSRTPDNGGSLLPEEVFSGVQRNSPGVSTPYFTPIQPAPSPVPLISPVASSFVNYIPDRPLETKVDRHEIKGRLNVEELEASERNEFGKEIGEEPKQTPQPQLHQLQQQPQQQGLQQEGKQQHLHQQQHQQQRQFNEQEQRQQQPKQNLNQSAFDNFIRSMKDAGQLPDKPCPVVSGLPDHLFPQPPKRTSPTFEKLKRSLSRSPSPKQLMKAVSTVASILVSNPVLDAELALKKHPPQIAQPIPVRPVSPDLIEEEEYINGVTTPSVNKPSTDDEGRGGPNQSVNNSSAPHAQPRLPTAFLPTSVLKKMHSEKQRESPTAVQQPHTPEKSPLGNGHDLPFSDLLVNSVRSPKPSPRESRHMTEHTLSAFDNLSLAGQLNLSNLGCDEALFHSSAPATPRHSINSGNHALPLPPHSQSAPNTPEHKFRSEPPPVQHVNIQPPGLNMPNSHLNKTNQPLMIPSAFHAPVTVKHGKTNDFGAIGSGIRQKGIRENEPHDSLVNHPSHQNSMDEIDRLRGVADPRLAPGNGVIRNTSSRNIHSPDNTNIPTLSNHSIRGQMQGSCLPPGQSQPSQQQQLLQAQRMAQIHQAQLHQQQKLQQIANQAKLMQQQKQQPGLQPGKLPSGVRPLLPDPEASNTSLQQKRAGEHTMYQQQQRQQIQAYHQQRQQMQQQQQQQQLSQQQQQQQPRTSSALPSSAFRNGRNFPNQNPELNRTSPPMQQQQQQQGLQNFQNMNRPQGLQNVNLAAQALVQQQLLMQAARARFTAQTQLLQQQPQQVVQALMAQAALVRGQAQAQAAMMFNQKNIQAMAEQMGIRHQMPNVSNKNIPTPMINNQLNQATPNSSIPNSNSSVNEGLSKWFGKDILNLLPQNNIPPTEITTGKVLSVEELERKQRSS